MLRRLEQATNRPNDDDRKTAPLRLLSIVIVSFVLAMLTRIGLINHPLIYDELYQYLPSVSWQENQTFTVLDGIYDRAARFSQFIAFSFDVLGEQSAIAARLIPSVIPGALLVAIVVAWAYHVSGRVAALIALCFLLFWPKWHRGVSIHPLLRGTGGAFCNWSAPCLCRSGRDRDPVLAIGSFGFGWGFVFDCA